MVPLTALPGENGFQLTGVSTKTGICRSVFFWYSA